MHHSALLTAYYFYPRTKKFLLIGSLLSFVLLTFMLPVKAQLDLNLFFEKNGIEIQPNNARNVVTQCLDSQCFEGMSTRTTTLQKYIILNQLNESDRKSLAVLDNTPLAEAKEAIASASLKYNVPVGFFTGIAFAESSAHSHYYLESDRDLCHNPWGLKPPTGQREDGSYLICFNSWNESTEHFAKLLRNGYLDRGANTIRTIAPYYKCGGWDGSDWCLATIDNWIKNVSSYSFF